MKVVKEYIILVIGVLLVAVGLYFFLMPNDIAAGGISGLAIIINSYMPALPVGIVMLIGDVILFIVAFLIIGPSFGAKTIFASLLLSFVVFVFEKLIPLSGPLADDMFIEMLFGVILSASGLAIIFNNDASTGGTDILAKILNKYFQVNMGRAILMVDIIVAFLALGRFGMKRGLYALLSIILNGLIIDRMIEGLNLCMEVKIISSKLMDIEKFILNDLERGATVYHAKGSYSKSDVEVLWTIIERKELIKLKRYIRDLDKDAFVSVSEAHETLGEGFKKLI